MRKFLFLCLMAVLCASVQSWAVVRYVNAGVSGGTGDGLSWPNAYNNLQSALTAALSGDEIWVAAGTYKPTTTTDRSISFVMKDGVAIYGGFVGNETALNQRPTINPVSGIHSSTSLSGDIGTMNVNTDNSYTVVTGSGTNSTAVLDGFTITRGNASAGSTNDATGSGGGMYNSAGSPKVRNCTFSGNTALAGGGMGNFESSPTVTNCTFSGNSATNNGGGMRNSGSSSPTVTNCTFSGNTALFGGGMSNFSSSPTVTNCTFLGNTATSGNGGGMSNQSDPSPTVTNCTFSGNTAAAFGGGMYNSNCSPTVTNCIIWNNTASGFTITPSASVDNFFLTPTFSHCLIANAGGSSSWETTIGTDGGGNIATNPMFTDATNGDYSLQVCSPAIDAGTSTGAPTTDILGNARVDAIAGGNIVDMGAYEYQSTLQEINLQGGSPFTNILDGDNTPSAAKGTDFGNVGVGSNVAKTFTIQNTGGTVLNISSITSTSGLFTVSGLTLPATITAGSSATFTVTFTPTATGAQNATITVNNDDCNEAVYDFVVTGAGATPDYSITTTSNAIVITDVSGNAETLDVSESSGNIRFVVTPTTRTYSIDGGPTTAFTTPADVALATKTSITINTAVGNDIINVAALGTNIPNLTINGGTGDDAVNFNGDITFSANANLDVDLQNNATPGVDQVSLAANANLILSGTGAAVVKVSRNVLLNSSSSIETANGNLTVEANQQGTPTSGLFNAVDIFGTLQASGSGAVTVKGKGGITTSSNSHGISVQTNGKIQGGTSGAVTVVGQGGGGGNNSYGVLVDQSAQITSSGGAVSVTGTGRGTGGGIANYGVLLGGGVISNAGTGSGATVTVVGQGGNTSGTGRANIGVYVNSTGSQITSSGGAVSVTGTGGGAGASTDNHGVYLFDSGVITSTGSGATVTVVGQGGNTSANTNHGVYVNGSSSKITSSSGAVSVTGTGGGTSADILTQSGGMITSTSTTAGITLNSTTNGTWPNAVTDVSTTATQKTTFGAGSKLNIDIDGTTANTEYQQLGVVGMIDLNGATLTFTGSTYTPVLGNTFTIVDNDGTDAVIGTFNGLAEGATIANFLGSGLNATITYTGGTGNDVVIAVCPTFTINAPTITQPTCLSPTGTIVVNASATGGGTLEYSINNGSSWQTANTYGGQAAGSYNIKVRLQASPTCEATYASNPVVLASPFTASTTTDTWTGCVSTDWAVPSNWADGTVPTAADDVNIPNTTNKPTIFGGTAAVAKTIEVQSGTTLTIATTASLTVNGSKSVAAGGTTAFLNNGTVENNGQLILGNSLSIGSEGLHNRGTFNNNTDGDIKIDGSTFRAILNFEATFNNSGLITIGATASVGQRGINNFSNTGPTAMFNNNAGEIKIDNATSKGLYNEGGGIFTNAAKITIGATTSIGGEGIDNRSTFNNNTGGDIKIDRTGRGLLNYEATFNNAALITIGATASVGQRGLNNFSNTGPTAMFNNNAGEIKIDNATSIGLYNEGGGIFTNAAKITIGATTSAGVDGLNNASTFNNNTGGQISIDRATGLTGSNSSGLNNASGTFTNAATITITNAGTINTGTARDGAVGIRNQATFNNNTGGQINTNDLTGNNSTGIRNQSGTFNNEATINIGDLVIGGAFGIVNLATFNNNTGGQVNIDRSSANGLLNSAGTFTNAATLTIGAKATVGANGIFNQATFNNNTGGQINLDRSTNGIRQFSGTFNNAAKITTGAALVTNGIRNESTFNNNSCGEISTLHPLFNSSNFTNAGLFRLNTTSAHTNSSTVTNNGIIEYPQGNPIPNVTNNDVIVAPITVCGTTITPALQIGGANDFTVGTTWYKELALTNAAGTYSPNTFTVTNLTAGSTYPLYFEVTDPTNMCTRKVEINVTVTTAPTATISYTGTPFCKTASPASVTLTGTTGGTYSALPAGLTIDTNTGQITPSSSTAGTYTVTYTIAASGGCAQVTATASVEITTAPTATIAYSGTPFCKTASPVSVTLTGTTGGTYSALPAGLTIDTNTGQITPSSSTAGTYTVTYTIAASGGCAQVTATASVEITTAPTATIAYSGTPFCKTASPVSVTQTGTTGGTYSALPAGLNIDASTGQITPSTSTAGTYTVTYTIAASGGCAQVTATASVEITTAPTATIAYSGTPFCKTASPVSVTQTGSTSGTYSALPAGLTIDASTGQITPSSSTAGTYTVTYTIAASGGCTQVTATASVEITTLSTATIAYSGTPFCKTASPASVTLTGTTGGTYSALPAGLTIDTNTGQITPSTSTAGTYTVTYTIAASGGCAQVTATASVEITTAPTATIAYSGTPFCKTASPVSVTRTGTTGGTYSVLPAGLTIDGTSGQITPSTSTAGTYTVTYTIAASGGCAQVTATASVEITTLSTATIAYSGTPFCKTASPASVTLTGTTGGTYSALPAGLTIDASTGQITPSTSTAGTYTVTYTIAASGGCAQVTATASVEITTLSTATIAYSGTPFCKTASPVSVTLIGTTGGTYSALPAGLNIDASTGQITPSTSTAGTYTVTYTIAASGGCAQVTATASVEITTLSTATIAYSGTPFCKTAGPASVTLTGTTGGTYSALPAGLTIDTNTGQITPSTSTAGTYTVTYTIAASGGCAQVTATANVEITTLSTATIAYSGTPFCKTASPVSVTQTGTTGGTYSALPAGLTIDASTGQITPSTSTAGTYTVTYTIAASAGCAQVTATASVEITTAPAATIAYSGTPFCKTASPVSVTLTGTTGGVYSSTTGLTIDGTTGQITPSTSTAGTYTVTYTIAASGGCAQVTATASVEITTAPAATIAYSGTPFCKTASPASVTLTGTSGGTYSALPAGLTIDTNTGQITPSTSTAGTYTVTYTIAASGGCAQVTATASVEITTAPTATIAYSGTPFCKTASPASVTMTGTTGGTYSALPAGLTIDTNTGQITPSSSTAGTYTVTYTIAASGGCAQVTATASVEITTAPAATIAYSGTPFCKTASPVSVTLTGTTGGVYSSTTGLTIDGTTGQITPSTSTAGTYTVTYTIAASGGCAQVTATASVEITTAPTATIAYSGTPFCKTASPFSVTLTGTTGGVYSSTTDLTIDGTTGQITPSSSTAGTYTVTYTIAASGGCAQVTATASVEITTAPTATIAYSGTPFCKTANPVSVTQTGTTGGTYSVLPTGLTINATTGEITPSSSTAGTYTVTYTIAASGGCAVVQATGSITVNPLPTASIATSGTVCLPTVTFTGANGTAPYTFTYKIGDGAATTVTTTVGNSVSVTPNTTGASTYTLLSVKDVNDCGQVQGGSVTVTVLAPIVGGIFVYNGNPYCSNGGTATVTRTAPAGGVYSTDATGLSINASTGAVNLAATTPGTYLVKYAYTGTCNQSATTTAFITITAAPSATIAYSNSPYCANSGTANVTKTGSVGTFSSTAGLSINTTTGAIDLATSTPGTYMVTLTIAADNGCAEFKTTASVTITPAVSATISYSGTPYCTNAGTATVTRTGSTGGTFSSTAGLSIDPSTGAINLATSTAGSYIVTLTIAAANGCAEFKTTANLTITPAVSASIAYSNSPYCANGGTATVTRTGSTGGTFSSTAGLSINVATGEINLATSTAGTYLVTLTIAAANGCAEFKTTASLTITPAVSATIAYSGTPYCAGAGTASVTRRGSTGGTFSSTAGLSINVATGEINLASSTEGMYVVVLTIAAANGCAEFKTTASVTITPAVSATIAYSGTPYCTNAGTATVTRTGSTGGTFSSTAGISIDANSGSIDLATSTAGTYLVTLTIPEANGCAEFKTTANLTITPAVLAAIAYSNSPYCANSGIATVTRTGSTGGVFSSTSGLNINATTGSIDLATSTPGTYLVTLTIAATNGCAEFKTTASVTITPADSATIAYSGTPYCAGAGTANVTRTGSTGGVFSSTSGLNINATTGSIDLATSTPGTYLVTLTIAAANGCAEFKTTASVTITPAVSASIAYSGTPYCTNGGTATVTRTGSTGGTFSSTAGLSIDANLGAINLATSTAGTYTVTLAIAAANGCAEFKTTANLTITPAVSASIAYSATSYCNNAGTATVTRTGSTGGTFSSTAGLSINTTTGAIDLAASTPGSYVVTYAIPAANGCAEFKTTANLTIQGVLATPTILSNQSSSVCAGTEVQLYTNCPQGSTVLWSNNSTATVLALNADNPSSQTVTVKCQLTGFCESGVSAPYTAVWVSTFSLTPINIGQSQSTIKSDNSPKSAWASQFITSDAGPALEYSTDANPTVYFSENMNKSAPRYWTIHVETCNLGTGGSLTFDMLSKDETGFERSYNTHENNAPYLMYANRAGFTELYAQNHPAYGFFIDNGSGGNVYDAGLPKGSYKLGIRYWDQKGWGSIFPSTRQPQGNVLAYQEFWFRIQSKNGIGTGATRVAADNGQRITNNGAFAEVMPNPISSTLRLKVSDSKGQKVNLSLVDASGRTLLQRAFVPETNQHQEEFNVSEIANGMYFLRVHTAEKQATLKVLKMQ